MRVAYILNYTENSVGLINIKVQKAELKAFILLVFIE